MKSFITRHAFLLSAAFLLLTGSSASGQQGSIQQSFENIEVVKINIGYGDLTVEKSTSGRVEVKGKYNDDEVDVELQTAANSPSMQNPPGRAIKKKRANGP